MKKGDRIEKKIIINAVESYISGEKSAKQLSEELDVRSSTIQLWVKKYQNHGSDWIINTAKKEYPVELKQAAVNDYLSGKGSLNEICFHMGFLQTVHLLNG